MTKRKQLRVVGEVMLGDSGRPRKVFCNGWWPKLDNLAHEVWVTYCVFPYLDQCTEVRRGYKTDRRIRADAELEMDGRMYSMELDSEHMDYEYRKLERRWVRYGEINAAKGMLGYVLVVTSSDEHMNRTIDHSEAVGDVALFTTIDRVISDPFGMIWRDVGGEQTFIGCRKSSLNKVQTRGPSACGKTQ